jgi:hypothetical protein
VLSGSFGPFRGTDIWSQCREGSSIIAFRPDVIRERDRMVKFVWCGSSRGDLKLIRWEPLSWKWTLI